MFYFYLFRATCGECPTKWTLVCCTKQWVQFITSKGWTRWAETAGMCLQVNLLCFTLLKTTSHNKNTGCSPFITYNKVSKTCWPSMTLPQLPLNTQWISIFYYTMTQISNIHEYHHVQLSVWYSYFSYSISQKTNKTKTNQQKIEQIPSLEKKLSETLQHRDGDDGQREGIIMISVLFNFTLPKQIYKKAP